MVISSSLKPKDVFSSGFHERLANLIFEVIVTSASVRHPAWACWSDIFRFKDGKTSDWIFRRICRLIYDEVRYMDKILYRRGTPYLGSCLNILDLNDKRCEDYGKRKNPLRLVVLSWVKCNYCRMREERPKVAEAFLHGNISFNDENLEFVETYSDQKRNAPNALSLWRTIADYTRTSIFEFGSPA